MAADFMCALAGFVASELRGADPMVGVRPFRSGSFGFESWIHSRPIVVLCVWMPFRTMKTSRAATPRL